MAKQLKRSVRLTDKERDKLDKLDEKYGMANICAELGLKKSTYYNLLNWGHGREDNIEKLKGFIKENKV